jgi:hypothetical protein
MISVEEREGKVERSYLNTDRPTCFFAVFFSPYVKVCKKIIVVNTDNYIKNMFPCANRRVSNVKAAGTHSNAGAYEIKFH